MKRKRSQPQHNQPRLSEKWRIFMEGNALRKLLKLQEADMRLRDMETRLATLPKEMDNIIAKRDKAAASTSAAVTAYKAIKARIKKEEDLIAELEAANEKIRILENSQKQPQCYKRY